MRLRHGYEGTPASSPDHENANMMPYHSEESYNSQPTLERSGSSVPHMSSPTDTVDTVIHHSQTGASNLTYDTPMRRSLGNFEPLIKPTEPLHPPPQDITEEEVSPERNSESQKLMNNNSIEKMVITKPRSRIRRAPSRARSYSPGSCGYCLSNMSCANMFLWISLLLAIIGWSVSTYLSIDSMSFMSQFDVKTGYTWNGFPFTDLTIVVIACATFLFSIAFIVVSTYTSEALSSYHLPSSQMNSCAYCFTIAMAVFSCIAVILWTLVIAVTMIPTTAIVLTHIMYASDPSSCIHLPSYGITKYEPAKNSSDSSLPLHCDEDLQSWLQDSWDTLTPLLCAIGAALFIEIILMGFIVVVSSNGRHLYERMSYLSAAKVIDEDEHCKPQQQPFI
ncbi:uncharacterized protein [Watersipora subatra]|uniref:uncharacterized protein isoform X2 n=1 Tax=Watersipora subatra TaxID=2589382 RepID=UPI00355B1FC7